MTASRSSFRRTRLFLALLLAATAFGSCGDDGTSPEVIEPTELAVVLASGDRTLTIFPVDSVENVRTVGLGSDGSPVTMALRGNLAAVPMGTFPSLVVADVAAGTVLRSIGLPAGSGATGAAFLNDSIVVVANPGLNTVSPVNVLRGTRGADIVVGRYPQAVVEAQGGVWVLNAELENFAPAGPATLSFIDGASLGVTRTVTLSGENAGSAAYGPGGDLWVVNSGSFGAANGSVSRVDPGTGTERAYHTGFGDFPGAIAFDATGRALVAAFSYGLAVWDPVTATFVRSPENAVAPEGIPALSGVGVDDEGRVYTLRPECSEPSAANRLDADFSVAVTVPVGICPFAIGFTRVDP